MYNIFVESLDKLNLGEIKTEAIKAICNTLLESNLSGDDSDTEYNDNVDYKVVKHLDNGRSIIVYEKMDTLKNGVSSVTFSKKHYNVIDIDGTKLYDKDFDSLSEFNSNLIQVRIGSKVCNFLNANGDLVSNDWFTSVHQCEKYGPEYVGLYRVAKTEEKTQWNIFRKDGTFLSETWYDDILPDKDGLFTVKMNNQYNFMNMYGNLICDAWFKRVSPFSDGFARVRVDGMKYNYINKNGEYLSENPFLIADDFSHGVAVVSRIYDRQSTRYKYNYINTNGDLISDIDFDMVYDFDDNGLGVVETHIDRRKIDENGNISESTVDKMNLINEHGEYILDKWVDECALLLAGDYIGDYIIINNHQSAVVDCKGNILREWRDIDESV